MKKWIKGIAVGILVLLIVIGGGLWIANKPLPQGKQGSEAELFADKLLERIGHQHFADSNKVISWKFMRGFSYEYNMAQDCVLVNWKENQVRLDKKSGTGVVYSNGSLVPNNEERSELLETAIKRFNNDSFWLFAPYKIKDPGTQRSLVRLKDGSKALLVTYTSGGSTPGDSYLWLVDETFKPIAWQLWVKIIPIGGLKINWEGWEEYDGLHLSDLKTGPIGIKLKLDPVTVQTL